MKIDCGWYRMRNGGIALVQKWLPQHELWEGKVAGVDPAVSYFAWHPDGEDGTTDDRQYDLVTPYQWRQGKRK